MDDAENILRKLHPNTNYYRPLQELQIEYGRTNDDSAEYWAALRERISCQIVVCAIL